MISAFTKAVSQLSDPSFRGVLIRSLMLTFCVFLFLGFAIGYGIDQIPPFDWEWVNSLMDWLAALGFVLGGFFLFPIIASMFISIYLDDIAEAVEKKHYPSDPLGQSLPILPSLWLALKFTAVVLGLNILVLPLYLIPGINLFLFYGLNGYLLSREYFELVAHRHLDEKSAKALRKSGRGGLFLAGVLIAFSLTVPLVNLLAPIVATAAMVHIFKGMAVRFGVPAKAPKQNITPAGR